MLELTKLKIGAVMADPRFDDYLKELEAVHNKRLKRINKSVSFGNLEHAEQPSVYRYQMQILLVSPNSTLAAYVYFDGSPSNRPNSKQQKLINRTVQLVLQQLEGNLDIPPEIIERVNSTRIPEIYTEEDGKVAIEVFPTKRQDPD
jgi:hypothetical protein